MHKRFTGFTIVELLIVIVVIAILAAVSIVAYGGVRDRANNSTVTKAAGDWAKIMKLYVVERGNSSYAAYACLGNGSTNFPATSTLNAGTCIKGFPGQPNYEETYNDSLRADIASVVSQSVAALPSGTLPEISGIYGNTQINARGLVYKNGPVIMYYLKGNNANCGAGRQSAVNASDTVTQCLIDI